MLNKELDQNDFSSRMRHNIRAGDIVLYVHNGTTNQHTLVPLVARNLMHTRHTKFPVHAVPELPYPSSHTYSYKEVETCLLWPNAF